VGIEPQVFIAEPMLEPIGWLGRPNVGVDSFGHHLW
jgi:hypothetical protein